MAFITETQVKAVIKLKSGKALTLKSNLFGGEEEIDMDKLLRIDVGELAAEIVTFPIILNQLGLLLADANNAVNEAKLTLDIYENKLKHKIYTEQETPPEEEEEGVNDKRAKPKPTKKKYTEDQVTAKIKSDPIAQGYKRLMYQRMKEQEYINSLFWSAKSKDDKLAKLSLTLQNGDVYDSLSQTHLKRINYVDIRLVQPRVDS